MTWPIYLFLCNDTFLILKIKTILCLNLWHSAVYIIQVLALRSLLSASFASRSIKVWSEKTDQLTTGIIRHYSAAGISCHRFTAIIFSYIQLSAVIMWSNLSRYYIWRCDDSNRTLIARFMGPTWDPSGADRTQVGPMLAPWILQTPHTGLALTGELWGVYFKNFDENWLCYNGTALYDERWSELKNVSVFCVVHLSHKYSHNLAVMFVAFYMMNKCILDIDSEI